MQTKCGEGGDVFRVSPGGAETWELPVVLETLGVPNEDRSGSFDRIRVSIGLVRRSVCRLGQIVTRRLFSLASY